MVDRFTLFDISQRTWALYRPNGECRSSLVKLTAAGQIIGYDHPNEASWVPHEGGFAFLSHEGKMTSITGEITGSYDDGWRIRMVHPDRTDRAAHVMIEIKYANSVPVDTIAAAATAATDDGGDHEVKLGLELPIPRAALRFLDPAMKRVFFVANNADIPPSAFEVWNLCNADVLVQYNKPMHFQALAGYACHKLQFMSPNGDSCWGFTDEGKPSHDYLAQTFISFTFALAHWVPTRLISYFESLPGSDRYMAVVPSRHIGRHTYPPDKAPSAGFITVDFFRFLNWIRCTRTHPPLELKLIGFTGRYPTGAWPGHDFNFEQEVYGTWVDLERFAPD